MSPRLLVLQHQPDAPVGWFGQWLTSAGVELDVLPAHEGRALPAALTGHAGLLVLGGSMGATDDDQVRWLAPARALIATVVAGGLPFLGICLGHQLAAVALGGTVRPNPHGPCRGLTPYRPLPEAVQDPLLSAVRPGALAAQWNDDVVARLPRRAALLASAPDGTVQVARFGARAWGVQFHPEASPEIVGGWAQGTGAPEGRQPPDDDPLEAVRRIAEHEDQLRRDWAPLAHRFARILTG